MHMHIPDSSRLQKRTFIDRSHGVLVDLFLLHIPRNNLAKAIDRTHDQITTLQKSDQRIEKYTEVFLSAS